nr:hypothetical protein [Tanacetum cinerariifolium]
MPQGLTQGTIYTKFLGLWFSSLCFFSERRQAFVVVVERDGFGYLQGVEESEQCGALFTGGKLVSGKAKQTEPAGGQGGATGPSCAGVASQGSSHSRWTKRRVQTKRISQQKRTLTQPVGRPKKKRKMSKHEDEPLVKDGKLNWKGRTITCQSCRNIRHNKATCKKQGRKETTVGQDGSGGSGAGAVIGLSAAAGEGGVSDPGGAGVASQGSSHTRWTKRRVQTERISLQKRTPTQPASQPSTSSQVPVSQTRNGDGIGDGVPTQSSAAGGASEWSFL